MNENNKLYGEALDRVENNTGTDNDYEVVATILARDIKNAYLDLKFNNELLYRVGIKFQSWSRIPANKKAI